MPATFTAYPSRGLSLTWNTPWLDAVLKVIVHPGRVSWLRNVAAGRVYDVAAVGRVTRRHGVPFLLDACQSVGQVSCPTLGHMSLPSAQQQSTVQRCGPAVMVAVCITTKTRRRAAGMSALCSRRTLATTALGAQLVSMTVCAGE